MYSGNGVSVEAGVSMDLYLLDFMRNELCPNGIWALSDVVRSVLDRQILRLPKGNVPEMEVRYPTSLAGMRAFLEVFFTRHYFQVQDSLIEYVVSQDFLDAIASGNLRILDVSSGPALASLAITDMLVSILAYFRDSRLWRWGRVAVTYVLNDTSGVCLGTGQQMLRNYFSSGRSGGGAVIQGPAFAVQRAFPDDMSQLRRIARDSGPYDIVTFSYVVVPLSEDRGIDEVVDGLRATEGLCGDGARIVILQDRFNVSLVRAISGKLGVPTQERDLVQEVYPDRNTTETYTYSYCSCFYGSGEKCMGRRSSVMQMSPDLAVAF